MRFSGIEQKLLNNWTGFIMDEEIPTLELLFEQLGLDSDAGAIEAFIAAHRLADATALEEAPFWTEGQRQFLCESRLQDAKWAPIVDELNGLLHDD